MTHGLRMPSRLRQGPWLTLSLTVFAMGTWALGASWFDAMICDREAVLSGQWWRLWTGHFTHYTSMHALGDIAAFSLWGVVIERRSRRLLIVDIVLGGLLLGAWVLLAHDDLTEYRGLSGLDALLLTQLIALALTDVHLSVHRRGTVLAVSVLLIGKAWWSAQYGHGLLTDDLGGARVLHSAHLFGAALGLTFLAVRRCHGKCEPVVGSSAAPAG